MSRRLWFGLLLLLIILSPLSAEESGPVVVVPLQGEVSTAQFFFLRRALKEAERDGASAVILDMDTNGGSAMAAIDQMNALLKGNTRTVTYVNPRALSAGALISLATHEIYMSPTAVIGAAAPILSTGQEIPDTANEKIVSTLSAMARAASQKNGHRSEVAEAFIRKEHEFKIGDTEIDNAESLLTLSAEEAARVFDGKPLLAAGIANSVEEVAQKAGLKGELKRLEPTGFERLAFWITKLAPLFLLGGIIGGYIEFKTPGFGIPGIIGLICFALFFAGHYVAGLAGWEVAVVFAIGVALVFSELFIHPGTVLPGVVGLFLMLGALVYAMVDRWPSEPVLPSAEMLFRPVGNLAVAFVLAGLLIVALARILPKTALYHHIVLEEAVASGPAVVEPKSVIPFEVGMSGTAATPLRPAGKAEVGGRLVDVVSSGGYIEIGQPIRIVEVSGARVVVDAA